MKENISIYLKYFMKPFTVLQQAKEYRHLLKPTPFWFFMLVSHALLIDIFVFVCDFFIIGFVTNLIVVAYMFCFYPMAFFLCGINIFKKTDQMVSQIVEGVLKVIPYVPPYTSACLGKIGMLWGQTIVDQLEKDEKTGELKKRTINDILKQKEEEKKNAGKPAVVKPLGRLPNNESGGEKSEGFQGRNPNTALPWNGVNQTERARTSKIQDVIPQDNPFTEAPVENKLAV